MKTPITQLTDTLWTGGDLPDGKGASAELATWVDAGIGVIIDCRIEWSDEDLVAQFAPQIRYAHHGIDDIGARVRRDWFDELLEAAEPHPDDPAPGVLVHCHMGINRGPSGAYALLLAAGYDPVEALALIRERRPIAGASYAEDALDWWHARNATPPDVRRRQRDALADWRQANRLQTIRLRRGDE